jgi:Mg2+ and Co2+ transporter CorA
MKKNTLENIEEKIRAYDILSKEKKSELLGLITKLKKEISELSKSKAEHAESIVGFMERSTHEATRKQKNPKLFKMSINGLYESVKEFEVSHPNLVEKVNNVASMLANMGI